MYDSIPTILTPKELLDHALGRASKIEKPDRDPIWRSRKTAQARVDATKDLVVGFIERTVKAFPQLGRLESYERELVDVLVGVGRLQKALGRLSGTAPLVERLATQAVRKIKRSKTPDAVGQAQRAFVGRVSSIVDGLGAPLAFLAEARAVFQRLPDIAPGDTNIVVAGYPNVGKSSLVARLTRAHPEVAAYPYTTKNVDVGHFAEPGKRPWQARRFQVIDTPGLLDKPPAERNGIEKQAALALAYLADVILFLFDPTESCGWPREDQERLLASVRKEFSEVPVLVVENKADLDSPSMGGALRVSCKTGQGIEELRQRVVEVVPKDRFAELLGAPDAKN